MIKNVRVQTKNNKSFKLGNKQIYSVPSLELLNENNVNKLNINEIFNLIRRPQVHVFEVSEDLTQELKLTLDNYMIKNIFVTKGKAAKKPVKKAAPVVEEIKEDIVVPTVEEPVTETVVEEEVKEEVVVETKEAVEVAEEVATEETTEEVAEEEVKENDHQQQYKKNNGKKKKNK